MAEEGHQVFLNIYDLSQGLARQLSSSFLGKAIEGIWHTGVVVYGNEYFFGGGIQSCPEGQTPYGNPYKKLELGCTQVPREVFEEYLQEISPRYTTETYSLLQHNCNNFSEEISQFLLGTSIPDFILKLPGEVMNSPMGALIMPMIQQFETILRHGGVPQVPHAGSPLGMSDSRHVRISTIPCSPTSNGVIDISSSTKSAGISRLDLTANASNSVSLSTHTGTDAAKTEVKNGTVHAEVTIKDKLGEARAQVQEEITSEFAALMAEGHLRASEAAALATRRVMERHGRGSGLSPQS